MLDESDAPHYRWFADGYLNASYNCLDRHVEAGNGSRTAIIFEGDDGLSREYSYEVLLRHVCRFANALKRRGVQKGERVMIYLPMGVECVIAMQACARIGAIHSVVFAGFSAKSLHERMVDTGAVAIVTCDEHVVCMPPTIEANDRLSRMINNGQGKQDVLRWVETFCAEHIFWIRGQAGEGPKAAMEHLKKVRNSGDIAKADLFGEVAGKIQELLEQHKADIAKDRPTAKKF